MKYTGFFKPGDIVVCDRFFYKHYGIYAGNDRVIHYAAKDGDFGADVKVREASLDDFVGDGKCMPFPHVEDCAGLKQFSPKETVKRARSRLGEKTYCLLFNNCEHFALWCKYGTSKSVQVEKAVSAAALLGTAIVIAYAAVISDSEE